MNFFKHHCIKAMCTAAALLAAANWAAIVRAQGLPKTSTACYFAAVTSPAKTVPVSPKMTITWSASTCGSTSGYWLEVGSTAWGNDVYSSGLLSTSTLSRQLPTVPGDGRTLYVTLWTQSNGTTWNASPVSYTAWTMSKVVLPATGMLRNGGQLQWTSGIGVRSQWVIIPGIYDSRGQTAGPVTITGLPVDGSRVTVEIWSLPEFDTTWHRRVESVAVDAPTRVLFGLQGPGARGLVGSASFRSPVSDTGVVIDWPAYNQLSSGQTHPAAGDLDGDGRDELVVGFGRGGGGWIAVFEDRQTGYGQPRWLRVSWPTYNEANGTVYPAVGDIDGDGRAEIVVGFGEGGNGWLEVFDDASAGFKSLGWIRSTWESYNTANGSAHPAVGDIDADGRPEIVVGFGQGGAGWIEILGNPGGGFTHKAWVQVNWPAYAAGNGSTWPAVGNLDRDAADEFVVGLGPGGAGWVEIFDDMAEGLKRLKWIKGHIADSTTEQQVSSRPAIGDLNGDGLGEIAIGLGGRLYREIRGYVDVRSDITRGFTSSTVDLKPVGLFYDDTRATSASMGTFVAIGKVGFTTR